MSSANLDLVRSIFAAWERGDVSPAAWAHPEIQFVVADGPEPGSRSGLAGDGGQPSRGPGRIRGLPHEADEYKQLGDERVLVLDDRSVLWCV